jgi:hypothetical protein
MWSAVVLMLIKLYCPVGIEQHVFLQNIENIFACQRLVYMELCILCLSLHVCIIINLKVVFILSQCFYC